MFPDLKVPVMRICAGVVVSGAVLALVHPVLAVLVVVGIGVWTFYRYFAALQCDGCRSYFIRGQFNSESPRTSGDGRRVVRYAALAAAIIAAVSVVIFGAQAWYGSTCEANCAKDGLKMDTKKRLFECTCMSAKP
jgi:hypothetical protein